MVSPFQEQFHSNGSGWCASGPAVSNPVSMRVKPCQNLYDKHSRRGICRFAARANDFAIRAIADPGIGLRCMQRRVSGSPRAFFSNRCARRRSPCLRSSAGVPRILVGHVRAGGMTQPMGRGAGEHGCLRFPLGAARPQALGRSTEHFFQNQVQRPA